MKPRRTEERHAKRSSALAPRARLVLLALALLVPALAEASVPRASALERESPDFAPLGAKALAGATLHSLTAALAPPSSAASGFPLFAGDELERALDEAAGLALASRAREARLDVHHELELLTVEPLRGPPESYPKTRIRGFELFEPFREGGERQLSLDLQWGCEGNSCELVSEQRKDPLGLASVFAGVSRKAAREAARVGVGRVAGRVGRRAAAQAVEEAAVSRAERQVAARAATAVAERAAVSGGLRLAAGAVLGVTVVGEIAQVFPANDASSPAPTAGDEPTPNDQQIKVDSERLRQALRAEKLGKRPGQLGAGGKGGGGAGGDEPPDDFVVTPWGTRDLRTGKFTNGPRGGTDPVQDFIEHAKENGFEVLGKGEISVETPFVTRRPDVILRNPATRRVGGIEIKSTPEEFAKTNPSQAAADRYINTFGAKAVGKNAKEARVTELDYMMKIQWPPR